MSSWLEIQKEILNEQEFIAEINLKTITLTRLGSYKATPYSLNLNLLNEPTTNSLKGVWRWWARIAIVGAYSGKANYKKVNKHLNKLLGGAERNEGVSLFKLEVSDIEFPPNFKDRIAKISDGIDEFYKKAEDFLITQEPLLKLPQNTIVSVKLNPFAPKITIENKRIPLGRYKNRIDDIIKRGPLKDYFVDSQFVSKHNRIEIKLRIPELNTYPQIPRIRLLLMKKEAEEDTLTKNSVESEEEKEKIKRYLERVKEEMSILVSEGLKFKVSLYGNGEVEKVNFALSSLLLSLILGGIGSITKRAFGSLKILSFKFKDSLKIDKEIEEIFQELVNKEFSKDELKRILERLCNITINYARRVFKIERVEEFCDIPTVPSLSKMRIEVIECTSPDLVKIGNAFVKQSWKTKPATQGRNVHTWILGLPRFQKRTGYAIKQREGHYDPLRRLSSIGVRLFKARNKNFIILFGLISNDWPRNLLHIRHRKQPEQEKPVKDITIGGSLHSVFDYAFKEVLKRVC